MAYVKYKFLSFAAVYWKTCTMWELWVKFYLGQNENYSLGDSISESSEKLHQSGRGEGQCLWGCGEGGVYAIKNTFFQKVTASLMKVAASEQE